MAIAEVIREIFDEKGAETYTIAIWSKAPAIVTTMEVKDHDGITLRLEPQIETWGTDDPDSGLSMIRVTTGLVIKAQVEADSVNEASEKGGSACWRMLTLLSLMANTAHDHFELKGILDVTKSRTRRGVVAIGPPVTFQAGRELTDQDVRAVFENFDAVRRRENGHFLEESMTHYVKGLNEKTSPADFIGYFVANEKLNPILKSQGRSKSERESWMTRELKSVRKTFLHPITNKKTIKDINQSMPILSADLASRARELLGELMEVPLNKDYFRIDKNRPVYPLVAGKIHDEKEAYSEAWSMPSLQAGVAFKGVTKEGVFVLDLEDVNYDTLPGTTFEVLYQGLDTGGRPVRPVRVQRG